LQDLWHEAFTQISHVRKYFAVLLDYDINRMPWNIRRAFDQVKAYCSDLFLHVASFLCRGVMVSDKALSFHAKAVSCFNKGKLAKGLQFGRAFQLDLQEGSCDKTSFVLLRVVWISVSTFSPGTFAVEFPAT
jgi:transposase, IS5 family